MWIVGDKSAVKNRPMTWNSMIRMFNVWLYC